MPVRFRGTRRALGLLALQSSLALAALSSTDVALAVSPEDKAEADALFDAGRQALDAEDYEKACKHFDNSNALDPAIGTLLNLGLCYKKAGKTASAWTTYREAAAMARANGQSEREELARGEQEALDQQLVRLVVEVADEASAIEGLVITRNGKELRRAMWGVSLAVDPGDVVVEARADGYKPRRATVTADTEGKTFTFKLEPLTKEEETAVAPPPPVEESEPEADEPVETEEPAQMVAPVDSSDGKRSPWPWVLGGAGVALAAGGTVFAILSKQKYDEASALCTELPCYEDEWNQWDSAQAQNEMFTYMAYGGWGVGGAAIIGATVWLLLDGKKTETVQVRPVNYGSGWGLSAQGSF